MSKCRRDLLAALREVADVVCEGARPHLSAIADHHGVALKTLKREVVLLGIVSQSGPYTAQQRLAHQRLLPHVALPPVKGRIDHDEMPRVEGAPPDDELLDACARWGIEGAAEEYDVSEATICRWMQAAGGEA